MLAAGCSPTRGRSSGSEGTLPSGGITDENAPRVNLHRGGHGPPLVLLHGLGSTLRAWSPVLPALERTHDVLALDLPGFGESPPLRGRSTVPSLTDAVEEVLDATGLEDVHVAGNSLGGWIALELARRGRTRSVVAISPAGMWTGRESAYAHRLLWVLRSIARLVAPCAEELTRTRAGRVAALSSMMRRPWREDQGEAAYALRALAKAPGWDETHAWTFSHSARGLEDISCPVRIAWGSRDLLLLPRQGPRFVRVIPGAELHPLPGLGHVPMSDDSALVARTIAEFSAGAEQGGR
jgi:pimeloyl-ACP methyl ester carboxylesterase